MSREIDLSGPDGNVFHIAGLSRSWAKQLGWTGRKLDILAEARDRDKQDYNDVLDIFDEWYKDIIDYTFINDPRDPSTMEPDDD